MSAEISLDANSLKHFNSQMEILRNNGNMSLYKALIKIAFKIKTESQERLKGRKHIVTSRLRNSIFVMAKKQNDVTRPGNSESYSDNEGHAYNARLLSITAGDDELIIGTNVEYAGDIEYGSKPHRIEPKNGKVLAWKQKAEGYYIPD